MTAKRRKHHIPVECQNLIEENRRLVSIASGAGNGYAISGMLNGGGSGSLSTLGMGVPNGGSYTSVESVILQTQVETLQWQLKQVDSSRHMYRAVMEEVVRFLDRCYRSLDALQSGQIGRSKSVLQVSKTGGAQNHHQPHHHHQHDSDSSSASSPRARSSTNLVEIQPKPYTKATGGHNGRLEHQQHQPSSLTSINNSSSTASQHAAASAHHEDECVVPPSPASSYSNFRDFTWRRSPKRTQTLPISSNEVDPEKLAQEAFRLLRTVQNLLNTQEPTLAQSTNALDSLISASTAASSCGSSTTLTGVGLSASGAMLGSTPTLTGIGVGGGGAGGGAGGDGDRARMTVGGMSNGVGVGGGVGSHPLVNTRSTVGFNRKLNMRGSRLSVRSSTADSVHSTSSSTKTETDEDNTDRPSPPLLLAHHHHHHHLLHHQSSGGGVNGGGVGSGGGGGGGGSSSSSCSSSTTSGNGSLNGNGHHHHHHHHHHHNPAHRYSANIERIKEMMISSSAEDESGFSSMNSFQEIGLPLVNSTMLSSVGSSHGVSNGSLGGGSSASSNESGTNSSSNSGGGGAGGGTFGVSEDSSELRENTVIPTTGASSNNSANKLGIPSSPSIKAATSVSASSNSSSNATAITATSTAATASSGSPLRATQAASYEHHTHFINHRRWDSAPVVPPKLKIHAGETDTVSRVLWV
uniref:Uncharacterized protein n=1 Tax=Anopheles dirus TaxID=7168 RepID=A0A182NIG7_9DIPT